MPKKKIDNTMLVNFNTWEECVKALDEEYTLTLKDMCMILKCSRVWATRYLKPHLHYIYIGNGAGKGANYLYVAKKKLGRECMNETTWYSKKEFKELIKSNLSNCTRQVINVPIEKLIKTELLESFLTSFVSLDTIIKEFGENGNIEWFEKAIEKHNKQILENINPKYKVLYVDRPTCYKRTLSPAVPFTMDFSELDLNKLTAIHDIKDYGDADETIYRKLFLKGCVRMVLRLPDQNGEISEKVYYLDMEEEFPECNDTVEKIMVKYNNYVST